MNISEIFERRQVAGVACLVLAGGLLAPAAMQAQRPARGDRSSAARIQRIEDTEEIRILLTDYGRFLDAHDLKAYSQLFAEDGEWVGGFGRAKGPAAIQALMEKNLGVTSKSKPGSTYHLLTNFVIDVQGNAATAWSRWTFLVTGADNRPAMFYGGHYDDILVRESGHWKFKRRIAANDIPQ